MHPELRARFNAAFTPARYAGFVREANGRERWPVDFRLSETPIFLTPEFAAAARQAAWDIVRQLRTPEFARHMQTAIPVGLSVPGEPPHPLFIQVDFGVCEDPANPGRLTPRLIELQGFPSLYAFQWFLLRRYREAYSAIPADWSPYPDGLDDANYPELLRRVIIGDHAPENVILLEIEPERQKTRIDFACTETLLGVAPVSLTDIIRRGKELFYRRAGREIRIERIYNRVIFDELLRRPDLTPAFDLRAPVDAEWAGHPNWYFRISKHSLPFLKTAHTAPAFFADEFPPGERLEEYVLKPLYSFAGLGVDVDVTPEKLAALSAPHEWILQKKVSYAEFVSTVEGTRSKAELRLMFVWPEGGEPILANNLVRMSQGKMMGVDFNKNKTWVGASIALFPPE